MFFVQEIEFYCKLLIFLAFCLSHVAHIREFYSKPFIEIIMSDECSRVLISIWCDMVGLCRSYRKNHCSKCKIKGRRIVFIEFTQSQQSMNEDELIIWIVRQSNAVAGFIFRILLRFFKTHINNNNNLRLNKYCLTVELNIPYFARRRNTVVGVLNSVE